MPKMTRFMTNGMLCLVGLSARGSTQTTTFPRCLCAASCRGGGPQVTAPTCTLGGKTKSWRITTTHNVKRARLQLCISLLKNNRLISYFLSTRRLDMSSWDRARTSAAREISCVRSVSDLRNRIVGVQGISCPLRWILS